MGKPSDKLAQDVQNVQVEDLVQSLMHGNLPKKDRIRLMKELVKKGDELPDEALELALKRLLERILF